MGKIAIIVLLVCASALAVWEWRLREQIADGPLLEKQLPAIGGSDLPGHPRHGTSCQVVRYSSLACHFCGAQFASNWLKIEQIAIAHGCQSVLVTPDGFELPLDGDKNAHAIAETVSIAFADATRLERTPTTFLIDSSGRVRWAREGVLTDKDVINFQKVL